MEFIPLDIIERVEMVRGPTSALYGRGAVAGAINYITKRVPQQKITNFGQSYGACNSGRPQFSLGLPVKQDKNSIFVSGYFDHKDGWRDRTERKGGNICICS